MALAGCPNLTLWGTQANGTYQNGAYWATPLSYMASALLQNGHGAFLESLLGAAVADFKAHGIYEDVDYGLPATAHGVLNYTASATNALLVFLLLLSLMHADGYLRFRCQVQLTTFLICAVINTQAEAHCSQRK